MNHIFDGTQGPIKPNNINSVVAAISKTQLGLDVLYEFLLTNLDNILNEIPNGDSIVTNIYSTLAKKITSDDQIQKVNPGFKYEYYVLKCFSWSKFEIMG